MKSIDRLSWILKSKFHEWIRNAKLIKSKEDANHFIII